jgi:hypothetical protein
MKIQIQAKRKKLSVKWVRKNTVWDTIQYEIQYAIKYRGNYNSEKCLETILKQKKLINRKNRHWYVVWSRVQENVYNELE